MLEHQQLFDPGYDALDEGSIPSLKLCRTIKLSRTELLTSTQLPFFRPDLLVVVAA